MKNQHLAFELEGCINFDEELSLTNAPTEFIKIQQQNFKESVPTAWGIHPKYGYFLLTSTGQGPCIDYLQNEHLCTI